MEKNTSQKNCNEKQNCKRWKNKQQNAVNESDEWRKIIKDWMKRTFKEDFLTRNLKKQRKNEVIWLRVQRKKIKERKNIRESNEIKKCKAKLKKEELKRKMQKKKKEISENREIEKKKKDEEN